MCACVYTRRSVDKVHNCKRHPERSDCFLISGNPVHKTVCTISVTVSTSTIGFKECFWSASFREISKKIGLDREKTREFGEWREFSGSENRQTQDTTHSISHFLIRGSNRDGFSLLCLGLSFWFLVRVGTLSKKHSVKHFKFNNPLSVC